MTAVIDLASMWGLESSTTYDAPKSNQPAISTRSNAAIRAINSNERVRACSTGESGGVSRRTSSRVIRFCTARFIATLIFLMVNGDHTPVTIIGCNLPQL